MRHSYTNATTTDGQTVVKRYLGPDAAVRQAREVAALVGLAGLLPLPALLESGDGQIVLELVPGTPGQELLVRAPEAVLRATGRTAARLRELDPALAGLTAGPGERLVHGDFGPHNLLFHPRHRTVAAVVDWELVRAGDPVADVAWAEWIVRTHHPDLVGALPALFDGLGERPPWPRRRAAMLATCDWALAFEARRDPADDSGLRLWLDRRAATERFRE